MPNLGVPFQNKWALLWSVVSSKLLFVILVWMERGVKMTCNRVTVNRPHHLTAIRIAKCYRSMSFEASIMLAVTPPADLLTIERAMRVTRLEAIDDHPISVTIIRWPKN